MEREQDFNAARLFVEPAIGAREVRGLAIYRDVARLAVKRSSSKMSARGGKVVGPSGAQDGSP